MGSDLLLFKLVIRATNWLIAYYMMVTLHIQISNIFKNLAFNPILQRRKLMPKRSNHLSDYEDGKGRI